MKKLFCMLLCVLLLASLAVPAFALTVLDGEIIEDGVVYDFSYSGIRITYPAEFKEVEGVVYCNLNGKRQDRDLYAAGLLYFGLTSEEWDELNELYSRWQNLTDEENERWVYLDSQNAFLPGFLVSKDESEVESFEQFSAEVGAPFSSVVRIGEADGYIFFYAEYENMKEEGLRPQYAEEYRKLAAIMREV